METVLWTSFRRIAPLSVSRGSDRVMCCLLARSGRGQGEDAALSAVVCHTPLSNLGHCRKGSTLSFSVAFQILKPGLYEVRRALSACFLISPAHTDVMFSPFSAAESAHEVKAPVHSVGVQPSTRRPAPVT